MEQNELSGPAWRPTGRRTEDKHKPSSMEGYYFWFMQRSESGQKKIFKYALARFAREHPERDPREVILEFFAESIYEYETYLEDLKKGNMQYANVESEEDRLRSLESIFTERADKIRASNSTGETQTPEQQAEKASGRFRVPSTSNRWVSISPKLGDSTGPH
tara:strand:+ start:686 stop:1171 length:486 start_codon:yes stop_codon:yes gene_type:complete